MATLTRIGVFYDGNFFAHVSNYYAFAHERKARIDIQGLHAFVRHKVAEEENIDVRYAQVVDAHYFRGRRSADDANLYAERLFDTVLMRAGVVTHYLPLVQRDGRDIEKGIDVWLALEAFESALLKRYDVLALIAGDADYLPLVRKIAIAGTRVMLLGFDVSYVDDNEHQRQTRTSQALLEACTYPLMLSAIIDDRVSTDRAQLEKLFLERRPAVPTTSPVSAPPPAAASMTDGQQKPDPHVRQTGTIKVLREGWGFIRPDNGSADIYFFHRDLANCDFPDLRVGMPLSYVLGSNDKGPCAQHIELAGVPEETG